MSAAALVERGRAAARAVPRGPALSPAAAYPTPADDRRPRERRPSSAAPPDDAVVLSVGKRFRCECGATFARRHDLARHSRAHNPGEKPFGCECGKRFGRLDALRRHARAMEHELASEAPLGTPGDDDAPRHRRARAASATPAAQRRTSLSLPTAARRASLRPPKPISAGASPPDDGSSDSESSQGSGREDEPVDARTLYARPGERSRAISRTSTVSLASEPSDSESSASTPRYFPSVPIPGHTAGFPDAFPNGHSHPAPFLPPPPALSHSLPNGHAFPPPPPFPPAGEHFPFPAPSLPPPHAHPFYPIPPPPRASPPPTALAKDAMYLPYPLLHHAEPGARMRAPSAPGPIRARHNSLNGNAAPGGFPPHAGHSGNLNGWPAPRMDADEAALQLLSLAQAWRT